MFIKKIIKLTFVFGLAFLLLSPSTVDARGRRNLTYRSTVVGAGVETFPQNYNRIKNAKNNFRDNEDVYVMTRVFNINEVNKFRIKQQVYRDGQHYKDFYSNDYYPHRNWWAETYAWNNIGQLPSGNYEVRTYTSVDNEPYVHNKNVAFNVANSRGVNTNYQLVNYNYNYNNNYQNYNYITTYTGTALRDLGVWKFEMINPKTTFYENEKLLVLGQLDRITGVDRFMMKYDLYRGNALYKTLSSWEQKPHGAYWAYNYTSVNFGHLPVGEYTLKTSININGGSFRELNSKRISVQRNYNQVNNSYYYHPDYGNYQPIVNNYPINYIDYHYNNNGNYNNNWHYHDKVVNYQLIRSTTGVGVNRVNSNIFGNNYYVKKEKRVFYPYERVVVGTDIDVYNADKVDIKHDLYRNNSNFVYQSKTISGVSGYANKVERSVYTDFGNLPKGNYQIKVYVRLNNSNWQYLKTLTIKVKDYDNHYTYRWTKTGVSGVGNGWYNYTPSLQLKSIFKENDKLSISSRIDNVEGLRDYRIKHELLQGGYIVKTIESPRVYNRDSEYSNDNDNKFFFSNFGMIPSGDYTIRAFVSINGSSYQQVDTRNVKVQRNYNSGYNYYY